MNRTRINSAVTMIFGTIDKQMTRNAPAKDKELPKAKITSQKIAAIRRKDNVKVTGVA